MRSNGVDPDLVTYNMCDLSLRALRRKARSTDYGLQEMVVFAAGDLRRWMVWADECTNDFLMSGLSTKDMPVTKADLIDVLCDYIMAIQDDMTLQMTWVQSFNPFKIEIYVKDLQNTLRINLDMTLKCFDMVVRLLDNKDSCMSKGEKIKDIKHYMDMRFWRMVGFGKLPKYHEDPTTEEPAKTLDCWPSMNYYIIGCRYVSMCSFRMYL
ncbi:hypothetical protein ZEAMMB73_Zm00001d051539 [Zea mays]|uniref:Uncharacterized protein n=1 Tax=Zea mays TaxID=4577 RepID=A0A1D6Q7N4_MAIZE|nr:hypothetical protein ZEAMMB73_Zm00001d051539 [Zea mays]